MTLVDLNISLIVQLEPLQGLAFPDAGRYLTVNPPEGSSDAGLSVCVETTRCGKHSPQYTTYTMTIKTNEQGPILLHTANLVSYKQKIGKSEKELAELYSFTGKIYTNYQRWTMTNARRMLVVCNDYRRKSSLFAANLTFLREAMPGLPIVYKWVSPTTVGACDCEEDRVAWMIVTLRELIPGAMPDEDSIELMCCAWDWATAKLKELQGHAPPIVIDVDAIQ